MEEVIGINIEIFKFLGLDNFANLLEEIQRSNGLGSSIERFALETERWMEASDSKKKRMFSFGGEMSFDCLKFYIISYRKTYNKEGHPVLILNEMPEGVKLKDNPIKNLTLVYLTEEERDFDYYRLKSIL